MKRTDWLLLLEELGCQECSTCGRWFKVRCEWCEWREAVDDA